MNIEFVFKENITEQDYWIAEKQMVDYFKIDEDPEQIQTQSYQEFMQNECVQLLIMKDSDRVIGSFYCVMTSKKLMYDFINATISENELFLKSKDNKLYEALYLCSTIIEQEYRRHRLGYEANMIFIKSLINKFGLTNLSLFYWPFSEGGKPHGKKIAEDLNLEILERL